MSNRPPMYLLKGPEELLLRRAADRVLAELRSEGPVELVDLRATEVREHGLPDLRTGSLFGDHRVVLIRDAHELAGEFSGRLLAELDGSPPDATVILLATGTSRIQKLARRIDQLGGRVDVLPPRDWEDRKWAEQVRDEFRRHKRTASSGAVEAVLAHAGLDVGHIAEKVAQVVATVAAGTIERDDVDLTVVGHGSRGSFAVADAMCDRQPARALELLRGVLESGHDPVMVLGALVYRLRSLIAVAGNVDAKSVGLSVSSGQARRLRGVRRNFGPGELTRAFRTLADADVELKSGELPGELVIERAVVGIATRQ